jgi:hypothetical protein
VLGLEIRAMLTRALRPCLSREAELLTGLGKLLPRFSGKQPARPRLDVPDS